MVDPESSEIVGKCHMVEIIIAVLAQTLVEFFPSALIVLNGSAIVRDFGHFKDLEEEGTIKRKMMKVEKIHLGIFIDR